MESRRGQAKRGEEDAQEMTSLRAPTRKDDPPQSLATATGASNEVPAYASRHVDTPHSNHPNSELAAVARAIHTQEYLDAQAKAASSAVAASQHAVAAAASYGQEEHDSKGKVSSLAKNDKSSTKALKGYDDPKQAKLNQEVDTSRPGAMHIPGMGSPNHAAGSVAGSSQAVASAANATMLAPVQAYLAADDDDEDDPESLSFNSNDPESADPHMTVLEGEPVKDKPWYRRTPVLVFGALLLVGVILGVVLGVVLGNKNNDPTTPEETSSPTSSPAPTGVSTVSMVIQLVDNPGETGWTLACGPRRDCAQETVLDVPQGTYSFLPISDIIPSFQVEFTALVMGSCCVLSINDSGGDGLPGGFYEIYYGSDLAKENRIRRVVPLTFKSETLFDVVPPNDVVSDEISVPVPAPSSGLNSSRCTVCPDGTPVPFPQTPMPLGGLTCGDLDNTGFAPNSTQCLEVQKQAFYCGCPNFCTSLCSDGSFVETDFEDELVRVEEDGERVTCSVAQDYVAQRNSSKSDCLTAGYYGENVCNCPSQASCQICQAESLVPSDMTKQILPSVVCEDIAGFAHGLKESDPLFETDCTAYQSIGAYCSCPKVDNSLQFCRICGGDSLLPKPEQMVNSTLLNRETTCIHVEFMANIGLSTNTTASGCLQAQEEHAAVCCA